MKYLEKLRASAGLNVPVLTPSSGSDSGEVALYAKSDNNLYLKNSSNQEYQVSGLADSFVVAASASLTVNSTTQTNITGLTYTLNLTSLPAQTWMFTINCDAAVVTTGAGTCTAGLAIGGTPQTATANFKASAIGQRATVSKIYRVSFATGSSYTITVFAKLDVAGGSYTIFNPHSILVGQRVS